MATKKEILNREITSWNKDKTKNETKKLQEILDPSDLWENYNKIFIKETGIYKIKRFTGAKWRQIGKEEIFGPTKENNYGYDVIVACEFPNGEVSWEAHTANDLNTTGISKSIKFMMAIKRARSYSLLRSENVWLVDLYSDGDEDSFKIEEQKKEEEKKRKNEKKEKRKSVPIAEVSLSEEDPKYPNMKILDVYKKEKDLDYLQVLFEDENQKNIIRKSAELILNKARKEEETA